MNISTQIAQAVVTGIKTLYGQEVTIDSVQLQETRPEFEGNMTLVVFPYLKMVGDLNTGERNLSFADIIEKLKDAHCWDYEPDRRRGKTDDAQKERMYFKRNFLTPLEDLGWIREDKVVKNRFRITQEGLVVLDIYYGD